MTNNLGLPLDLVQKRLTAEGQTVSTVEVSSRKGSRGNDARVIKIERKEHGTVVYWSRFQTTTE